MKIVPWLVGITLLLSACEGWPVPTIAYNPPTLEPSRTPFVMTATPVLSPAPLTATVPTSTNTPALETPTPTLVEVTPLDTLTPVVPTAPGSLSVQILGCDTSIDITHGMGEVTNAYVTIRNATSTDLQNLCATLNALDEGRLHPDKKKCLPSLAAGFQVTFRLTVDTTYEQNTPVQVDVTSSDALLQRVGTAACTAIGVLPPDIDGLDTPQAVPSQQPTGQP